MQSRSSSSRSRSERAVLVVVIVGAIASIATSKRTQQGKATLPSIVLQPGGPPVELRIHVASGCSSCRRHLT